MARRSVCHVYRVPDYDADDDTEDDFYRAEGCTCPEAFQCQGRCQNDKH